MKRSHNRRLGLFFWAAAIVALGILGLRIPGASEQDSAPHRTAAALMRYLGRDASTLVLADPVGKLQVGDPVFFAEDDGGFRQVGRVRQLRAPQGEGAENLDDDEAMQSRVGVQILWYESTVKASECQMFQYHSSGRLSEVVETLLPPEKQQLIRVQIARAMADHGEQLSHQFTPLVEDSLRRSLPVIEEEFREAVARHRDEIDAAARRWNDELVQGRLIPMARKEILPIVKKHGQPPAEDIGREIWDRASLFRFGWRAIYDKSPLPQKDLVREEWKRFVEQEAVPILEKHMDKVVVAIQRSVRDVSKNPAVRSELGEVAEQIASDPQSRELIQVILKETFVENERLRKEWREVWSSDEARDAFNLAGEKLEPVVRRIGDEIFGSEQDGINPDFARVLRSQILRKDRRWVVAWHTGASNGRIELAKKRMPYPVVYIAQDEL